MCIRDRDSKQSEFNELDDVPGLDDWLTGSDDDDSVDDNEILDDLDSAEFDELLQSLESDGLAEPADIDDEDESTDSEPKQDNEAEDTFELEQDDEAEDTFALEHDDEAEDTFELEQNDEEESTFELENDTDELDDLAIPDDVDLDIATPAEVEPDGPLSEEVQTSETQENDLKLDNPDLDLAALLSDGESEGDSQTPAEDFLDVESLMDDGDDGNTVDPDSQMLDLDVSLSDFTGVSDEDTVIDIDKDAGQNANLDLARAYIEMEDVEAAKELLDEVIKEGSEEQKQEDLSS